MEKEEENVVLGKNDSHFVPVVYATVSNDTKKTG